MYKYNLYIKCFTKSICYLFEGNKTKHTKAPKIATATTEEAIK